VAVAQQTRHKQHHFIVLMLYLRAGTEQVHDVEILYFDQFFKIQKTLISFDQGEKFYRFFTDITKT
jgi:hypothetical protein